MNRAIFVVGSLFLLCAAMAGQTPELKFIADTLVVQADGTYEADPDLATLTFQIFSQEKVLKQAYDEAAKSMERIANLAAQNGLQKQDVSTGVLTVAPIYDGDRKKRARAYYVQGQIILRVRDFSHIGPILDGSVEDGVTDFRSLTYSLADEEAAKKEAVAAAMRRAVGRATIALEQKGQKLGALRYMSLDVKQVYGVVQLRNLETMAETVEVDSTSSVGGGFWPRKKVPPPPPPPVQQPQKIAVSASVQCAFQIQ